jgi:hypothetical protein
VCCERNEEIRSAGRLLSTECAAGSRDLTEITKLI